MERSIKDVVQVEGLTFALYTIYSRAIPHLVDGFKPVHRFFIHSAMQGGTGFQKVASIAGGVAMYGYHHGETSVEEALSLMAAHWCNNIPLFDRDGFFGSRLVKKPGAPRYIKCKLSPIFKAIYMDGDLTPVHEDPEHVPPAYYLPIIPMVLVNGFSGIAKAYATNIPPHDPKSVVNGCIAYLNDKDFTLDLKYPYFKGEITDGTIYGTYELQGKTKLVITEIPVKYDRVKYIAILDKLEEKGVIVSYKDLSKEDFRYEVTLKREYANGLTREKILKDFGLIENSNPNINVIFEGKLYSYERPETLLKDFVDIRMNVYQQRINKRIQETKEALDKALAKVAFITQMVESPDSLRGLSRSEAVKFVSTWIGCENHAEMLVAMNIYHLTTDESKKLEDEAEELHKQLKYWEETTPKIEYLNDLKELSKKLK